MKKKCLNKCTYVLEDGKICGKEAKTHKYICDKHAEEQEMEPYGRFCEFCRAGLFEEETAVTGIKH